MNRLAIIALVSLCAYCLLDVAVSMLVAALWRTRAIAPASLPPAVRARRLLQLRLMPSVAAFAVTLFVVTPAFMIFEPPHTDEKVGPMLAFLSVVALLQIGAAITFAARSAWLTGRVERQWLRSSQSIAACDSRGLRAFAIQSSSPMVALVGVFAPKLIASSSVIEACTSEEIACIVAHERGHFDARDNLKRWIMASAPDALRWTRLHHEIVDTWHHAAEDAADDAATGGDPAARAELAALLLKVVRLAPQPVWDAAIVSPFVEQHGLERRVKRLLQPDLEPPAPLALIPVIAVGATAVAIVAILSSPSTLKSIFETFERLVAFGR